MWGKGEVSITSTAMVVGRFASSERLRHAMRGLLVARVSQDDHYCPHLLEIFSKKRLTFRPSRLHCLLGPRFDCICMQLAVASFLFPVFPDPISALRPRRWLPPPATLRFGFGGVFLARMVKSKLHVGLSGASGDNRHRCPLHAISRSIPECT
jgi:hypothetical protein